MRGHKVVTVERQGGYAARCETCGDITFGGFATRTEARAALTHEEGPAAGATADEPKIKEAGSTMTDTQTTDENRSCERFSWCSGHFSTDAARDRTTHFGEIGQYVGERNELTVTVFFDEEDQHLSFSVEPFSEWSIKPDEIDLEIDDYVELLITARWTMLEFIRTHEEIVGADVLDRAFPSRSLRRPADVTTRLADLDC